MKPLFSFIAALLLAPAVLAANPQVYDFDYQASEIAFIYEFSGDRITGRFPDFSASLVLDFDDVRNSSVSVDIDTSTALGGFIFGTQAMRGPKMLDARNFPTIRFVSTSAKLEGNSALLEGDLSIREATRPITLKIQIFRASDSLPSERDDLTMTVEGTLNRYDFGVDGYPELVGDDLSILITARIIRRQ
jgi:polyisoprenoid-binding protein YceI